VAEVAKKNKTLSVVEKINVIKQTESEKMKAVEKVNVIKQTESGKLKAMCAGIQLIPQLESYGKSTDLPLYMELEKKIVNQTYHLKFNFQLKPPHVISEAVMYSNVSSDITSIIGHTTVFL
jgi:hypothetical protein